MINALPTTLHSGLTPWLAGSLRDEAPAWRLPESDQPSPQAALAQLHWRLVQAVLAKTGEKGVAGLAEQIPGASPRVLQLKINGQRRITFEDACVWVVALGLDAVAVLQGPGWHQLPEPWPGLGQIAAPSTERAHLPWADVLADLATADVAIRLAGEGLRFWLLRALLKAGVEHTRLSWSGELLVLRRPAGTIALAAAGPPEDLRDDPSGDVTRVLARAGQLLESPAAERYVVVYATARALPLLSDLFGITSMSSANGTVVRTDPEQVAWLDGPRITFAARVESVAAVSDSALVVLRIEP